MLRTPHEDSIGLYPGLVVSDGRVTGSITIGESRLPVWAIVASTISEDWSEVYEGWPTAKLENFKPEDMEKFLYRLLECRGEFGRLLLMLANAHGSFGRWANQADSNPNKETNDEIISQLKKCIGVLENRPCTKHLS